MAIEDTRGRSTRTVLQYQATAFSTQLMVSFRRPEVLDEAQAKMRVASRGPETDMIQDQGPKAFF